MNTELTNVFTFNYGAVYIPNQCMSKLFDPEDALSYGTAFPELVDEYTKFLR